MSVKIKVSYTEDAEASSILSLLSPVIDLFKVKKSEGKPYSHIYLTQKKDGVKRE